jgi:hypothetical protein
MLVHRRAEQKERPSAPPAEGMPVPAE